MRCSDVGENHAEEQIWWKTDWIAKKQFLPRASLVAQLVEESTCQMQEIQETLVWSLSREDLLEKEMATHSSILGWEIPWTEEPGELQSMGSQELDTT